MRKNSAERRPSWICKNPAETAGRPRGRAPRSELLRVRLRPNQGDVSRCAATTYVAAPFDTPFTPNYDGAVAFAISLAGRASRLVMRTVAIGADHGGFELKQLL